MVLSTFSSPEFSIRAFSQRETLQTSSQMCQRNCGQWAEWKFRIRPSVPVSWRVSTSDAQDATRQVFRGDDESLTTSSVTSQQVLPMFIIIHSSVNHSMEFADCKEQKKFAFSGSLRVRKLRQLFYRETTSQYLLRPGCVKLFGYL